MVRKFQAKAARTRGPEPSVMEDFQREMRGSFFGEAEDRGDRDGAAAEARAGTGERSSEGERAESPEKTWSETDLASAAGLSGAEAEERRAAAEDKTDRGLAGVFGERAFEIAGCMGTATAGG